MPAQRIVILAAAVALAFTIFLREASAVSAQGKVGCMEIEQRQRMVGHIRMLITPEMGKLETTHYSLLLPQSGNIVHLLNDQTRRFTTFTVDQFRKKFSFYCDDKSRRKEVRRVDHEFTDYSELKKLGSAKVAGLNCTQYSRFRTNNKPPPKDKLYIEDIWFTSDIKIPPKMYDTYRRSLGFTFDTKYGVPVRIRETRTWFNKKRKTEEVSYDTISYKKTSQVNKSEFVIPTAYTKVKDEMAVLMDDFGGDDSDIFQTQPGGNLMLPPKTR